MRNHNRTRPPRRDKVAPPLNSSRFVGGGRLQALLSQRMEGGGRWQVEFEEGDRGALIRVAAAGGGSGRVLAGRGGAAALGKLLVCAVFSY